MEKEKKEIGNTEDKRWKKGKGKWVIEMIRDGGGIREKEERVKIVNS